MLPLLILEEEKEEKEEEEGGWLPGLPAMSGSLFSSVSAPSSPGTAAQPGPARLQLWLQVVARPGLAWLSQLRITPPLHHLNTSRSRT